LYKTTSLWLSLLNKGLAFLCPLLLGFSIAYALYPFVKMLNKKIPKFISILIVMCIFILFVSFIIIKMIPLLVIQILSLIDNLNVLVINYNLSTTLLDIFDKLIDDIFIYIQNGISFSFKLISNFIIVMATSVYFLKDMDKIRQKIINYVSNKELLYKLDLSINNYFKGLFIIIIITFFEYLIVYLIINHPLAILLAFLASLSNLIPQFGSLIVHIISLLTSLMLGKDMLVKMIIAVFVFSIVDSYIINPLVYQKSNQLHPLLIIVVMLLGSVLFGFMGIVVALPLTIILISIYNYYVKN